MNGDAAALVNGWLAGIPAGERETRLLATTKELARHLKRHIGDRAACEVLYRLGDDLMAQGD